MTRRGQIVAVILSLDESLEFVIGYAEEFTRARAEALERDAGRWPTRSVSLPRRHAG